MLISFPYCLNLVFGYMGSSWLWCLQCTAYLYESIIQSLMSCLDGTSCLPHNLLKFCCTWVIDFVSINHSIKCAFSCTVAILKQMNSSARTGCSVPSVANRQRLPSYDCVLQTYCIWLVPLIHIVQIFHFVTCYIHYIYIYIYTCQTLVICKL